MILYIHTYTYIFIYVHIYVCVYVCLHILIRISPQPLVMNCTQCSSFLPIMNGKRNVWAIGIKTYKQLKDSGLSTASYNVHDAIWQILLLSSERTPLPPLRRVSDLVSFLYWVARPCSYPMPPALSSSSLATIANVHHLLLSGMFLVLHIHRAFGLHCEITLGDFTFWLLVIRCAN